MAIYYGHNNVKFTVANQSILVDSVTFSLGSRISENQEIDKKGDFKYVVENGAEGSLSLSYYLEGADPLLPYLYSDSSFAFDAAGLTQSKAYLTSYSITADPFGPAKVSATLSIYEDFGGSFTPATLPNEERVYLKFSDMDISFQGIDATSNITSMSYSVSKTVDPVYLLGNLTPSELRLNNVITNLSLESYNFVEALPYDGKSVSVNFSLGSNEYNVDGIMEAKDVGFAFADKIKANLSVKSNSYGAAPVLSNNSTTVSVGNILYIWGTNLQDTTTVYFHNNIKAQKITTGEVNSSTGEKGISLIVPRFARSGPVRIVTPNGEVSYNVTINNQTFIP